MATVTTDVALFDYVLRLGDDSLILGQRLSEWCGHAPSVEVDLSLANMALDLVGQATHFLHYAGQIEGEGRTGDDLAFHRDVLDFRNCLLVEQPNGDFAQTMVRQFLYSTWQKMLLDHLAGSTDALIASVAAKAVKEIAYHQELSAEWVIRLGDGTEESRGRALAGLDWMWRFIPELFEADAIESSAMFWPRRRWSGRRLRGRSSAAAEATIASISATCSAPCNSFPAPIRTRHGSGGDSA